jgi:hypothetical protein
MPLRLLLLIVVVIAAGAGVQASPGALRAQGGSQLLVQFRAGVSSADAASLVRGAGAAERRTIPRIGVHVLTVPSTGLARALGTLKASGRVAFAEQDGTRKPQDTIPNDPFFPQQYALAGGAWGWFKTRTTQAWDITKGDPSVVVAVLDTGLKSLPDFSEQTVTGWNVLNNSTDTSSNAGNHGTYVAGVVGLAIGNGRGNAGYCPGCRIMPVQVGTDSGASDSGIASGITWAADHGARVVNLSWAGPGSSSTLASAVAYARSKGVVVVAAAGNSNCDCANYPAATPGVLGVAGTTTLDAKQGDSNYGSWVMLAAPEGNMTAWPALNGAPGYSPVGGTSLASPVVAAIAGLLYSYNNGLSGTQVEQALESSAAPVAFTVKYGRVDALAALQSLGASDPQATSAPVNSVAPQLLVQASSGYDTALLSVAPQVGEVLVRGQGAWTGSAPLSLSGLQWQRCDLAGLSCTTVGTSATYTVQSADAGYRLRLVVTAKNGVGSTSSASPLSLAVGGTTIVSPPVNTALPSISGTTQEGQTLSASTGTWSGSPTAYGYQWQRCDFAGASCASVAGATVATYTLTSADVGFALRVVVTATNSAASVSATSALSALVAAAPLTNTALPIVSGAAQDGQALTASTGTWTGAPTAYAYQWQRCDTSGTACTSVAGATSSSYGVTSGDVGSTLRVVVTATTSTASASATSAPSSIVAASSSPPSSQTVTFSGSLNARNPTRTFSVTLGAGLADAQLSFTKCSTLSLALQSNAASSLAAKTGPSVIVLDSTLPAGKYTYAVSGGRCSFTLTITSPAA